MQVHSIFQDQFHPEKVLIEMSTRFQIPSFQILGLPAPEIQEARERIMAAFLSSGFDFPKKKVIVNLAPSALPKSGTGHDLAIAITILQEVLELPWPEHLLAWGELGLNGKVKPCGHLATLIEILLHEKNPLTLILSPIDASQFYQYLAWRKENKLPVPEAFQLICLEHLEEVPVQLLNPKKINLETQTFSTPHCTSHLRLLPLQPSLRRLILLAMSGRHHALLLGPKGVGKSQALEWFKALTPPSDPTQTWTRLLHSQNKLETFSFQTPIRRVHAQVKPAHLLGSSAGKNFRPGELALAHGGLFIADEFLEWHRDAKECLREPLENKEVHLTKLQGSIHFPCDVHFVGTGNLCKCGGLPPLFHAQLDTKIDPPLREHLPPCRCRHQEVLEYFTRVSGPIADRIDLMFVVTPHSPLNSNQAMLNDCQSELTELQKNIAENRLFSKKTFGGLSSELAVHVLEKNLPNRSSIQKLLKPIHSLRSRHKILRMAHTLQAMEKSETLQEQQLFEAVHLRWKDVN